MELINIFGFVCFFVVALASYWFYIYSLKRGKILRRYLFLSYIFLIAAIMSNLPDNLFLNHFRLLKLH